MSMNIPHYAESGENPLQGTQISQGVLSDGRKELHDLGDGIYRVSVFQQVQNGSDWDFEEFADKESAQDLYESLESYEDLTRRQQIG